MTHSQHGLNIDSLTKVIEQVIESFKTPEKLSLFERGQVDGLRWTLQLIAEIKTPPDENT